MLTYSFLELTLTRSD